MKPEEIHRCWAPDDGPWSPWVKPVLFAALRDHDRTERRPPVVDLPASFTWLERDVLRPLLEARETAPDHPYREGSMASDTAIVVDLPGERGAKVGIALAILGYRPVPLYNALPGPRAVVPLTPIMDVLVDGSNTVAAVPVSSPPAFLLDANRLGDGSLILAGSFDNRSICRASDFPSAATLQRAGLRRAVLLSEAAPAADLQDALLTWQANGIEFWHKRTSDERPAARIILRAPNVFARTFQSLRHRLLPLRPDGSFGEFVGPSSG